MENMTIFNKSINILVTMLVMVLIASLTLICECNASKQVTVSISSVELQIVNQLDSRLKVTLYTGTGIETIVDLHGKTRGFASIGSSTPTTLVELSFEVDNVIYIDGKSILELVANTGPHKVVVTKPCLSGHGLFYKAFVSKVQTNGACALPIQNV
jgi:hypothetical protein